MKLIIEINRRTLYKTINLIDFVILSTINDNVNSGKYDNISLKKALLTCLYEYKGTIRLTDRTARRLHTLLNMYMFMQLRSGNKPIELFNLFTEISIKLQKEEPELLKYLSK